MLNIILTILLVMALFTLGWRKTMTVIVETTSLMEEIVFRDIVRIEDKEEWIVLNDKNGRCLPMPKQGIENIKVLDILTNKEG